MHRVLGFLSILWGALALRLRLVRPRVDDVSFYAYRKAWGRRVVDGFTLRVGVDGPMPGPGTLIVCNHSGLADVAVTCAVLPATALTTYISKKEVGDLPLFGWHMRRFHDVLFDRAIPAARRRVIDDAMARLRAGFSVVLFPEGTRSRSGRPKDQIHPALIDAALAEGMPIQPIALRGTTDLLEHPWRSMPRNAPVHLELGETRRDFASSQEVWSAVLGLWEQSEARREPAAAVRERRMASSA